MRERIKPLKICLFQLFRVLDLRPLIAELLIGGVQGLSVSSAVWRV